MASETTAVLGAQPVTVVIQGPGQGLTVDVHPANRVAPMAAVFKAELPDYFDTEDYKPTLRGFLSREEYNEVFGEVNQLYREATALPVYGLSLSKATARSANVVGRCCALSFACFFVIFALALVICAVILMVDVGTAEPGDDVFNYSTIIPPFFFLPIGMVLVAVICVCIFLVVAMFTSNYSAQRMTKIGDYLHAINREKYNDRGVNFREVRQAVTYRQSSGSGRAMAYWIAIDVTPPPGGARAAPPSDDEYNL